MTHPDHERGPEPAQNDCTAAAALAHPPEKGANDWSIDETGLPVYRGRGLDAAIDEWRAQTSKANERRLSLGAIASDVSKSRVYGRGDFDRLVAATGLKKSAVHSYKSVYERLASLEISTRMEILARLEAGTTCFSTLKAAAVLDDPDEFRRVVVEVSAFARERKLARALNDQHNAAVEAGEEDEIATWNSDVVGETSKQAPGSPPASEKAARSPRPVGPDPREKVASGDFAAPEEQNPRPVGPPENPGATKPMRALTGDLVVVRDAGASLRPGSNLGDCLELAKLLAPDSVSALILDPPYGVGDIGGRGRASQGRIKHDEDPKAAARILRLMLAEVKHSLAENVPVLVFASPKSRITALMMRIIERSGYLKPSPIPLVWYKGVGRWCQKNEGARRTYEAIIYAQKGTPARRPSEDGDVISCRPSHTSKRRHFHEKPLGLMAKLVQDYVPEGGLVLDPFSGGGSTLDACALLGRRAVGFELDPKFHGRAERRLDRVRRAPDGLRERWLHEALAEVFVQPRGLDASPIEPMGLEALVMEALSEDISSRVRPLFDDMERLFAHVPPPPPGSPYAMLSEEIRKLDRLGA